MLTDVRRRDQHLGQRNRVVGQEVDLQVLVGLWVSVDDASHVDDESDCQLRNVVCKYSEVQLMPP